MPLLAPSATSLPHAMLALASLVAAAAGCSENEGSALDRRPASLADGTRPLFEDVTDVSGVRFEHVCGTPEKRYIIDANGSGVALFDYDGDGDLDLYLVNGATEAILRGAEPPRKNLLFRNDGDWRFQDVTDRAGVGDTAWGCGCAVADVDDDGDLDLYVTNYGPNRLYLNRGDGTFEERAEPAGVAGDAWSCGAAFGDSDGDGRLDLYVSNYVDFDFDRPPKAGPGCQWKSLQMTFYGPVGLPPQEDFLYRNAGDGTFEDVSERSGVRDVEPGYGFTVVWLDYDDDGDLDLYVANDSTPNFLFRNDGSGRFTSTGPALGVAFNEDGRAQAGMGIAVADYDGNHLPDLFLTNFDEDSNTLYANQGDEGFLDRTRRAGLAAPSWNYVSWGTAFLDFDLDSDLDLVLANGHVYPQVDGGDPSTSYRQVNQLFENTGDGRFHEISREVGGVFLEIEGSRGLGLGDLDNDGDLDLLVSNIDARATLARNNFPEGSFALFQLEGRPPGRTPVGARILVETGASCKLRDLRGDGSYVSHSDLRVHFGLAGADRMDRVEIRWPRGVLQAFLDLDARRIYVVVEEKEG